MRCLIILGLILIVYFANSGVKETAFFEILKKTKMTKNDIADSSIIEGFIFDKKNKNKLSYGFVHVTDNKKFGTYIDSSGYFKFKIVKGKYRFLFSNMSCDEFITDEIYINSNSKYFFKVYLVSGDTTFCY